MPLSPAYRRHKQARQGDAGWLEGDIPQRLYKYKKSGVLLMGLQGRETVQASLFDDPAKQAKSAGMMHVMDGINRRLGKGSLAIAASGISQRWAMRRERKSPDYTTDWDELRVAG